MQKEFFFFKGLLASLLLLLTLPVLAFSSLDSRTVAQMPFEEFKIEPRVSLWGFTGDFTRGEGQALLPIYGDQDRAFFGAVEGNVSANDNDWLAGLGLGYRQVVKDYIVGIYTFADCLNSVNNNTFWVANPGIEVLGQKWDFNANGYAPFIHKEGVLIDEMPASDMGIFKFASFKGHDQFDHLMQIRTGEEAGRGFDAEIGRVIPHFEQAKLYLGGYHFDSNHGGSINGAEARFLWELNKYAALEVKDYYDNKNHNVFMAGVRLTLGGLSSKQKETFGISSRLMDPIEHDFVINEAGNMPAVIPVQRTIDLGKMLVDDNVWFFVPAPGNATTSNGLNAVVGNGTFEHPFVNFTPDNFNAINPNIGVIHKNPSLYFAPGNYSFENFISFTTSVLGRPSSGVPGRFMLPSGWGMFGRSLNYKVPSKSAVFTGGGIDIGLDSGFPTILNSIIISKTLIEPGFSLPMIMDAENSGTIILKNSDLFNILTTPGITPAGIFLVNSVLNFENLNGTAGINNIAVERAINGSLGIGVVNSTINFNSGINNLISTVINAPSAIAFGIQGIGGGINSINFGESTTTIKTVANTLTNSVTFGIIDVSFINFTNATNSVVIDVTAEGSTNNFAVGIIAISTAINFTNSANVFINATTNGVGSNNAFGIDAGSAVINFANSANVIIDVAALGGVGTNNRTGILADSSSLLQRNGVNLTALFPLEDFVTFIDGGGTSGDKAKWDALTPPFNELPW